MPSARRESRNPAATRVTRRNTNRRHMTGDHHGRTTRRATMLVRAADEILGTHTPSGPSWIAFCERRRGTAPATSPRTPRGLAADQLGGSRRVLNRGPENASYLGFAEVIFEDEAQRPWQDRRHLVA
jgi:hypothetical protein